MAKKSEEAVKVADVQYVIAHGKSIGFRAGIKADGDAVDVNWPEFKLNKKLLDEMLENGSLVKK